MKLIRGYPWWVRAISGIVGGLSALYLLCLLVTWNDISDKERLYRG